MQFARYWEKNSNLKRLSICGSEDTFEPASDHTLASKEVFKNLQYFSFEWPHDSYSPFSRMLYNLRKARIVGVFKVTSLRLDVRDDINV